jgi:predicted Zn finger-like uncharacterized protein
MRFSCGTCNAQYMISDEKVGPNGVKVRCKRCGAIIPVKRAPATAPSIEAAPAPSLSESAPGDAPASASAGQVAGETTFETELGTAFQNVFGGGSAGVAAESAPTSEPPPAARDVNPTQSGAASAESFSEWYVAIDDNQVGPLPPTGVKTRWESGEVGPDTLAWRPGMGDWQAISTIPEMAQYLAPVPRGSAKAAAAPIAVATPIVKDPAPAAPFTVNDSASAGREMAGATPQPSSVAAGLNGVARNGEWKPAAASALAALGVPCFACTPELFPEMMAAAINRADLGAWAAAHDITTARAPG